jgi:LAO/AO transport system kinase
MVRSRFGDLHGAVALPALAARVVSGELDPYTAADELVAGVT